MSHSTNEDLGRGRSTAAFAAHYLVKPQSVIARYCRKGSYFGIKPRKLENGRLLWPLDETPESTIPARDTKAAQ